MTTANDAALIAALGMDAVAAVAGYRRAVVAEAARRGLRLVDDAPSEVTATGVGPAVLDSLTIHLAFEPERDHRTSIGRVDLSGRTIRWSPATGWQVRRTPGGSGSVALHLVPTPPAVLDWAVRDHTRRRPRNGPRRPTDLRLDEAAVRRLVEFIEPGRRAHARKLCRTPHRRTSTVVEPSNDWTPLQPATASTR